MIEVEGRPLRTLEKNALATSQRLVNLEPGIDRQGEDPLPEFHTLLKLRSERTILLLTEGGETLGGTQMALLEKGGKADFVQGIDHTDSTTADLLFIGRSYPTSRRSDLPLSLPLSGEIEGAVVGEEEMGPSTHSDPAGESDPPRRKGIILLEKLDQIEDDTVPEEAPLPGVEDPGRDLMEDEVLLTHLYRMSGVGAALIAGHHIHFLRQDVDDLPLPLVTPLGADDDDTTAFRSSTLHFDSLR
jgi:hypothetical protein